MNQINGKIYIGQAIDPKRRWTDHQYNAKKENPPQYIHRAMAKHGVENFTYEVIAISKTQEDANDAEIILIAQYDSRNKEKGYNLVRGGGGISGWKHTNAAKEKMSGQNNHMYGKTQTEYNKQKLYEANKGRVKSEKECEAISERQRGNQYKLGLHHSEETKEKLSLAKMGNKNPMFEKDFSEEHRKNLSESLQGRIVSEETRKKIGAAHRGKKMSEEQKHLQSIYRKNHPELAWFKIGHVHSEKAKKKMSEAKIGKPAPNKTLLTKQEILDIKNDQRGSREIAKQYKISRSRVQKIKLGKE